MNSPLGKQDDSVTDPDPHNANQNSLEKPIASDWMSDDNDDDSPNARRSRPSDDDPTDSQEHKGLSNRGYGWTLFLLVIAILGNLTVPFILDRFMGERYPFSPPQLFPEGSVIQWVTYYHEAAFRASFFGVWFAEYVALWLWMNSYVPSRTTRWLLGLFACAVISYTVVLGMSIAWGPAPADFFWFSMIGSLGLYATINLLLKLLLRRSDFRWQPIQLGTGNRYSIRVLLGTMIGSAILMLGLKLFPYDSGGMRARSALDFVPLAIWLAWVALSIATLIWLQLGSILSPRRGRFILCFFALAIFGPILFHLVGTWLLAWNQNMQFTIQFEQFVIVYSIEVGLVAGVALLLPLLPRRMVDG